MPDFQVLVGTSQGLTVLQTDGSKTILLNSHLEGEWITSVAPAAEGDQSFMATTRSGLLAKVDAEGCKLLGKFPGRACVSLPFDQGIIYVGARPAQVYTLCPPYSLIRPLLVERSSSSAGWHSHSGRSALISSLIRSPTDPNEILCGIEVGGVLRSKDCGQTWNDLTANLDPDVHDLVVVGRGPTAIVASTGTGLFSAPDSGEHWSKVIECALSYFQAVEFIPATDTLVASASRAPFGRYSEGIFFGGSCENDFALVVAKYSDMGWCMTNQFQLEAGVLSRALALDPFDPDHLYAGDSIGRLQLWSCTNGLISDVWKFDDLIECLLVVPIDGKKEE